MKNLKYALAFIPSLVVILAIYYAGMWSFLGIIMAAILIPITEFFLEESTEKRSQKEEETILKNPIFDLFLYFNLPLYFGMLYYFGYKLSLGTLELYEIVGLIISVSILCTSIGINVAHELGHRHTWYEQLMAKTLLMSCLYMHFFIEHNQGHHKNIGTDADPASSKYGENLYAFFLRSIPGAYFSAWRIEARRLKKKGLSSLHWQNSMIRYQVIQMIYLWTIYIYWGGQILGCFIIAAVIGVLLLETINYVEHYGLRRKRLASGKYEKVSIHHSWNSNHTTARIFFYQLTLHSDHHTKSTRKYQILRHFKESPQLPYSYVASIFIAFVPHLWFQIMNKEVDRLMKNN